MDEDETGTGSAALDFEGGSRNGAAGRCFRFGAFELDEMRCEVRRNGRPVPAQPQVFKLLAHLIRHRERAVSRDELLEQVWPGVFVSDGALSTVIYEARTLVGDDGHRQEVIRTLRGHGFRFVAGVVEIEAAATVAAQTRAPGAPFVGRTEILARLQAAWSAANRGYGRVVLIEGEAGIGKTSTLQRFLAELPPGQAHIGRCHEGRPAPPLWPWVQILRRWADQLDGVSLRRRLGDEVSRLFRIVPSLRDRLADVHEPARGGGSEARFQLFDAVAVALRQVAAAAPVALLLDDLQWADQASLRLLEFLAVELADAPVLIAGTYRDDEVNNRQALGETLGGLLRQAQCERHVLPGLAAEEIRDLLFALTSIEPAPALVARFIERTDGNPLFIKEIIGLSGAGTTAIEEGADLPLPRGLREVIGHRIGRLPPPVRQVLSVAAVLGRDFHVDLLREVWDGTAPLRMEWVDDAVRARFLARVPGTVGRVRFAHALIREAIYAQIEGARAAALHRRAAEALAVHTTTEPEPHLAELAHHWCEAIPAGADAATATDYCVRAGERAIGMLAYEEAAHHYARALQALEWQRDAPRRRVAEILLDLGDAQAQAGDLHGARATFDRAAASAEAGGWPDLLARAALGRAGPAADLERALVRMDRSTGGWAAAARTVEILTDALRAVGTGDAVTRARLLGCLARELPPSAGRERPLALASEALDLARRAGDPAALAEIVSARREVLCGPDDVDERLAMADEIVALAEKTGDRQLELRGRAWRLIDCLERAEMTTVRAELAVCGVLAQQLRQPHYAHIMTVLESTLALLDGRFADAELRAGRALEIGRRLRKDFAETIFLIQMVSLRREQGRIGEAEAEVRTVVAARPGFLLGRCGLAYILAETGRLDEARVEFERLAWADFTDILPDRGWLALVTVLAAVCYDLDDRARAARLFELLQPYASRNVVAAEGLTSYGSAAHQLGLLATTLGRWDEAERYFDQALSMNERLGARAFRAQIYRAFGLMLLRRGGTRQARRGIDLLEKALVLARQFGMNALVTEIPHVLEEARRRSGGARAS